MTTGRIKHRAVFVTGRMERIVIGPIGPKAGRGFFCNCCPPGRLGIRSVEAKSLFPPNVCFRDHGAQHGAPLTPRGFRPKHAAKEVAIEVL